MALHLPGSGPLPPAALEVSRPSFSYLRAEDYRVARVGFRIGLAGRDLCPRLYPMTGLLLHHLGEYAESDRPEVAVTYRLNRGPAVLAVVEHSPAAQAGLVAGDVLLNSNGIPFASGRLPDQDPMRERQSIEAIERQFEESLTGGSVRLTILRDGYERQLVLNPIPGCPARVRLARSTQFNAFANRGYAIMTTALLNFVKNDDELAIVLGHEIAHNILNHPQSLNAEGVPPRGLLRQFGKNASRVKQTEIEADRLGLRLAWAAGYDLTAAAPFWRRYSARVGPRFATTHPGLKAREKIIAETIAELGSSQSGAQRP